MRKPRIQLQFTYCKRCGKSIATTNRSIIGLDSMKSQFENICSKCATNEEVQEILKAQGKHLSKGE